jgi:single-strand DNA-binding protein
MNDSIMVRGLVATTPRAFTTSDGVTITSFRLATSQRRYDSEKARWVDTNTNWYTVSCKRSLGKNAAASIVKGDRVIVYGDFKIDDWENTDRSGTTVEIHAETIGHDMFWGTSTYTRTPSFNGDEYGE